MTITFPRDLPLFRFISGSSFALERQVVRAPTRGGLVQVANIGTPLWRAKYQTPALTGAQVAEFDAWLDSLRGGARHFKAVHPFLRYARGYPSGYAGLTKHVGGSFAGVAQLDAVGGTLDTVTLSDLPNGFILAPGDLLSWTHSSTMQTLHRVVEGATSALGVMTVGIEPSVLPGSDVDVDVALGSPWFKAVIDQASASVTWQTDGNGSVTFEAWQVFA